MAAGAAVGERAGTRRIRRRWDLLAALDHFCFRRSRHHRLHGVLVGIFQPSAAEERIAVQKVETALDLIREWTPGRFARLRRHVDSIWLFGSAGNRAEWHDSIRQIRVQLAWVLSEETSAAELAAVLVHEATHAWLDHLGIEYREANRARIEAACVRAQLRFARRLPAPGKAIEEAQLLLSRHPGAWTDQSFRRWKLTECREMGLPEWGMNLVARRLGLSPGLRIRCAPQPVDVRYSAERNAYVWSYRTEVRNDGDVPVRVTSFVPLVRRRLRWVWAETPTGKPYDAEVFASWYGAPDGWIAPGQTVTCERTGSWRPDPRAWRMKWWYGGHDAEGNWYTGETVVQLAAAPAGENPD